MSPPATVPIARVPRAPRAPHGAPVIAPRGAHVVAPVPAATYTIGQLAREFELTTRAIRFYEDSGLLAPERQGRHRIYSQRDRTRLKLTLRGKRLGLTLAEVRELVDMYESPRDTGAQLRRFLLVLAAHRNQLEQRMADLSATLEEVGSHQKEARRLLATPAQKPRAADANGPAERPAPKAGSRPAQRITHAPPRDPTP
jgi:DNA-binding transcriptional MerR regulator